MEAKIKAVVANCLPTEIVEALMLAAKVRMTGHITVHFKDGLPRVIKTEKETRIF
jgi:hypothetical protein